MMKDSWTRTLVLFSFSTIDIRHTDRRSRSVYERGYAAAISRFGDFLEISLNRRLRLPPNTTDHSSRIFNTQFGFEKTAHLHVFAMSG